MTGVAAGSPLWHQCFGACRGARSVHIDLGLLFTLLSSSSVFTALIGSGLQSSLDGKLVCERVRKMSCLYHERVRKMSGLYYSMRNGCGAASKWGTRQEGRQARLCGISVLVHAVDTKHEQRNSMTWLWCV